MSDTDVELLARYTGGHAEDAFAEIVRRHLGLVHSAGLRQVRSPQLAQEVAQSTFVSSPGRHPTPEKRELDKLAVRQIGTNAIPILLQWISASDGPPKQKMITWISRHSWVPFRIESEVDKNMLAASGFSILGKSQAGSAVPALVAIVRTGGGTKTSAYDNVTFAMSALADIDPEAATKAGVQFGTNRWSGTNVTVIGWSAPPAAANR